MATKRKREDDKLVIQSTDEDALRKLLSSSITNPGSAEIALRHIMEEYSFDPRLVQQILTKDGLNVSFSKVNYLSIAPFVGLQPKFNLKDIQTFELYRSRIPTTLFKSIVEDIDLMLVQHGPPVEHETEEAKSRFLSPIFNRLISVFDFAFRNMPESIIEGRITTKGRVEHFFKAFGSVAILFIEVKFKIGNIRERLDAIGQVIAECDADLYNTQQGFRVPVYCILCDGEVFEFFRFDGSTKPPSFHQGCDSTVPRTRLSLPDFTQTRTPRPFIDALRPICEIIFDLMLKGYSSSLQLYHNRSVMNSVKEGKPKPRKSLDKWEQAIRSAHCAMEMFRDAEMKRQVQLIDEANATVQNAMESLKDSIDMVPINYYKMALIMSSWDDREVEKV